MSKMLKIVFLTAVGIFLSLNSLFALHYYSNSHLVEFQKTADEYNQIRLNMDKCIYLLEKDGTDALDKIRKIDTDDNNFGGVYVIDPETGKILVHPDLKPKEGKNVLKTSSINGKVLAKDAIEKWQKRRSQGWWDDLIDVFEIKHMSFYTDIAVTDSGKTYVVAISKNDLNLQRLFVVKVVHKACDIIKKYGPEEAYKVFDRKDSVFKHKHSYIYVYSDSGVCLYNPNYPELEGKNAAKIDPATEKMVEVAKKKSSGWLECKAKVPGKKDEQKKEIYFQSVFADGKTYIVGSGIYVKAKK
ncbi:MAG: cache domain-containing protein [Victivallales bacterium]|nr:cache domain-containing protein [Victivallales bacterium]MCF7888521.1 cache domain-containing protein [Victivallales bacterium]